ncbi:GntR family transcriptional regulator [Amycolatopsis sp. YIM 10]|uniref:GntR family transcriptional regulator n=1 Tax=Amycolatopsis sp. YIM 10 TaxID=2653857 RepID=UPI00128FD2C4|nr:GntR family transcriptional regulator [Amycolatopsis sp. YIM 10]QFU89110.1 putative HTH-type transcriptional regulator YdfH [Amycolatopsis sp. YIM 10]
MTRDELEELLRTRILAAEIAPGERINESAVAEELGVSRTPVREALLRLEGGGLVRFERGRGFLAAPLSAEQVRETYPIIAHLEVLAVTATGAALRGLAPKLAETNTAFAAVETAAEAHELDAAFHRILVSRCGNRRLIGLIGGLWRDILRYEHVYFADAHDRHRSALQHAAIVDAVAAGEAEIAARAVADNTTESMHLLLDRL